MPKQGEQMSSQQKTKISKAVSRYHRQACRKIGKKYDLSKTKTQHSGKKAYRERTARYQTKAGAEQGSMERGRQSKGGGKIVAREKTLGKGKAKEVGYKVFSQKFKTKKAKKKLITEGEIQKRAVRKAEIEQTKKIIAKRKKEGKSILIQTERLRRLERVFKQKYIKKRPVDKNK